MCVCLYWVYVCLYVCARLAQFKDLWLPTGARFIAWPGWGLNFGRPSFSTPSLDRDIKRSHTLVDKSRLTESGRGWGEGPDLASHFLILLVYHIPCPILANPASQEQSIPESCTLFWWNPGSCEYPSRPLVNTGVAVCHFLPAHSCY